MSDDNTTSFRERAKVGLEKHKGKAAAVGGVSVATIALCYQIFLTQSHFETYKAEASASRASLWRALQEQQKENREADAQNWRALQDLTIQVEVLKYRTARTNH